MWLLITTVGFTLSIAAHALVARLIPKANRVVAFFVIGALAGAALLLLVGNVYGALRPETLAAAVMFAFACELYVFFFTLSLSSISANLLGRLSKRALSTAEVEGLYDSRRMVTNRLRRLADSGMLRVSPAGIEITARGNRVLRMLNLMRHFFGHDTSSAT